MQNLEAAYLSAAGCYQSEEAAVVTVKLDLGAL